ncbi:MAG: transcriptional regulator [Bacteroidetes bacterium RBG_13_43_22]|nr:MAG: transcriptional regulator [Bacteroidetes bacterium RBG_13_43_22]OFY82118.1 MAG: transcriptional regulator [Bacteroidetes bacterium RBG_19FT_COMBO_42_7]
MAPSKTDKFTKEDIRLARFAKAMAHPARIAILRHLASLDACCFNEISREIPLADSTVSQHMSELKSAGLIQGSFEPPRIKYCINAENWKLARKYFKDLTKTEKPKKNK